MTVNIIGIKQVNFTGKDGNLVSGTQFFCTYTEKNVKGLATEKFFISPQRIHNQVFNVGDNAQVFYNRYGKVEAFEKLNK